MTIRPAGLAAGVVVAVLALSGCGSASLSDGQLHARATRICRLAARRTDRIPTPALPDVMARFIARGVAALGPELTALRALRPPGAMATEYRSALRATADELQALRSTLKGLRAGGDPLVAIKTLQGRLAPAELRAHDAWSALSLPACEGR